MGAKDREPAGPLFETSTTRVLAAASEPVAELLSRYLKEPLREISELRSDVRSYLAELTELADRTEFLDLAQARRVGAQCEVLLSQLDSGGSAGARRLVQAAIRYFVEDEDAESDTDSPIGFDDDLAVVELVARELGCAEVRTNEGEEGR